jgi:hypothetical protein
MNNEREWKKVSITELRAFIQTYPVYLEYDCTGICEPPMRSWNDFSHGKVWPESMVAKQFEGEAFGYINEQPRKHKRDVILEFYSSPDKILNALHQAGWEVRPRQ